MELQRNSEIKDSEYLKLSKKLINLAIQYSKSRSTSMSAPVAANTTNSENEVHTDIVLQVELSSLKDVSASRLLEIEKLEKECIELKRKNDVYAEQVF